jgi:hypothetical protein
VQKRIFKCKKHTKTRRRNVKGKIYKKGEGEDERKV